MAANPARYSISNPAEPVLHELPPIRYQDQAVGVRIAVRRTDGGTWRARLLFGALGNEGAVATAEIFCAANEADLWQSVRDLPEYHVLDLYRSLVE